MGCWKSKQHHKAADSDDFMIKNIDFYYSSTDSLRRAVKSITSPDIFKRIKHKTRKKSYTHKVVSDEFVYAFDFCEITKAMLSYKLRQVIDDHVKRVDIYKLIRDTEYLQVLLLKYVLTGMGFLLKDSYTYDTEALRRLLLDIRLASADETMAITSNIGYEGILKDRRIDLSVPVGYVYDGCYGTITPNVWPGLVLRSLLADEYVEEARHKIIEIVSLER